nr:ribonuclease H-like domain-containing protein [Tanacetum cinerariifolium]
MNNANGNNGNRGNNNNLLCKNYGLKGHTIERFFAIIGYPPSFKRNRNLKLAINFNNNRSNNVDNKETFVGNNEIKTSVGTLCFNNEQVLKLMSLLNDKSGSTSCSSMEDLKREKVLGTGSESVGLYMFYVDYDKDLKFYETVFPFKMSVDESVKEHTEGASSSAWFYYRATGHDGDHPATPLDEQNNSEGNFGINKEVYVFQNDLSNVTEKVGPRRSQRPFILPVRLNDFVLDDKVKNGLDRYVNHSFLCPENCCFVSNLNKCNKPSFYEEVVKDVNWVNSMNEKMHALYENKTWTMTDLPYEKNLLVLSDDLVITGSNVNEIEKFKSFMNNKFKIKDLGIEVLKTAIENIVLTCKKSDVDKFLSNITNYQKPIGKLIYLTHTRPDIYYSIHCLSQHLHAPSKSYFDIAMRVLNYLNLAYDLGVNFSMKKSDCLITAFYDSDWAKCPVTRRSISEYYVSINTNPIMHEKTKHFDIGVQLVPASVPTTPSIAADVSVSAVSSVHANTEVTADESRPDDNKTASEHVSAEHTVDTSTTVAFTFRVSHTTPSSSRKRHKQLAKKRVTPIEPEFERQQEELAQKAQAEGVASPAEQVRIAPPEKRTHIVGYDEYT